MNNKSKYELDERILKKTVGLPNDDIQRVVKKLSLTYNLLSLGAGSFEIDPTVEPSALNPFDCLKIWNMYLTKNKGKMHPAQIISSYNVDNDIKVNVGSVVIGDEILPVKQCTIIPKTNGAFVANVAAVSDILATSYRHTKQGFSSSIAKPAEQALFGVPDVKAYDTLIGLNVQEANPSQAALCYFDMLSSKPRIAIPLMSDILKSMPGEFSASSTIMSRKYKAEKGDFQRDEIFIPKISSPKVTFFDKLDTCYKFLDRSRAFRGEDGSGVGALSIGYNLFKMPRHYAKSWAYCQDMRMLCAQMGVPKWVNFLEMPGTMHLNVLIANGFCCGVPVSGKKFDDQKPEPGLYMNVPGGIVLRNIGSKTPSVTKLGVTYMPRQEFENLAESVTPYQVIPIHLNPYMEEQISVKKGLGYMPSSMGHNGIVYMGIFKSVYTMNQLIRRFSKANSFRNTFVYHRVPFNLADPMGDLFRDDVIFPKTRNRSKKDELYDNIQVDESVVNLKIDNSIMEIDTVPPDIASVTAFPLWTALVQSPDEIIYEFEVDILDNLSNYYDKKDVKFLSLLMKPIAKFYDNMSEFLRVHDSYPALKQCLLGIQHARTQRDLRVKYGDEIKNESVDSVSDDEQSDAPVMITIGEDDQDVIDDEEDEEDADLMEMMEEAQVETKVKINLI